MEYYTMCEYVISITFTGSSHSDKEQNSLCFPCIFIAFLDFAGFFPKIV